VYDNEKLKLKLIWKFIRLEFPPLFICRTKEGKKPHEFLQFSKHKTANERGICDVQNRRFNRIPEEQIKQIYIRVFFFRLQQHKQQKFAQNVTTLKTNCCFYSTR
jgi:uncharacterized protein with von Willebrand factor type A (vWA) domain